MCLRGVFESDGDGDGVGGSDVGCRLGSGGVRVIETGGKGRRVTGVSVRGCEGCEGGKGWQERRRI